MKVILAGTVAGKGGVQSHVRWLAKALGEAEIQTLVLSLNKEVSTTDIKELQSFWNSQVHLIDCSAIKQKNNSKIIVLEVIKTIKEFNPDIYLAVGVGLNLFIPPIISFSQSRLIFHEVMSGLGGKWRDPRWWVRWGFDEVVAQASPVAENFASTFGWKKPIPVLPALPEPLEITTSLPKTSVKKVPIGTAKAALFSRLASHKRAFWLVQQWDLLKDFLAELHIHGDGGEELLIRDYIEEKGIGDRVKCFGPYPEGQAYVELLSSYDLTLLPTIGAEGAPLVLLESMACGVPFVTYGVGGLPDYGVNNPNVLIVKPEPWTTNQAQEYSTSVSPDDEPVFVTGIKQMVHKLAHGEIDQVQLQQFYLEHYSYEVLKQLWLSYFVTVQGGYEIW